MKIKAPEGLTIEERIMFYDCEENEKYYQYGAHGGWKKDEQSPVFGGGELGTCFDVSVRLEQEGTDQQVFKMWFSWRPKHAIGYTESKDGLNWNDPVVVFEPVEGSDWEGDEVNRPTVIYRDGQYMMWYCAQMGPGTEEGCSAIGLAVSEDGIHWTRREDPVMRPDKPWELHAVMCPHVIFDEEDQLYKLWYAAGSNYEPDALGYAYSKDGISWIKEAGNPVIKPNPEHPWEQHKIVAPYVIKKDGWFHVFYVGHFHEERAHVGLARSRDGISGWEWHPENPLICPDKGNWDSTSVFKPCIVKAGNQWMMWYNGAMYDKETFLLEQIGVAYLDRDSLF